MLKLFKMLDVHLVQKCQICAENETDGGVQHYLAMFMRGCLVCFLCLTPLHFKRQKFLWALVWAIQPSAKFTHIPPGSSKSQSHYTYLKTELNGCFPQYHCNWLPQTSLPRSTIPVFPHVFRNHPRVLPCPLTLMDLPHSP